MQRCYVHPKIEAIAHCRGCKLPSCFHCLEDQYCAECVKLRRYLALGQSETRRPKLVETPVVRSKTMELMIQRLQAQAFDPDAASRKKKPRSSLRKPVKTYKPVSYGLLLPGLAPMIRVTRSPLNRIALLAVALLGLSSFFAHPHRSMATTIAAPPVTMRPDPIAEVPPVRHFYRPSETVYVLVPPRHQRTIVLPRPVSQAMIRYIPAVVNEKALEPSSRAPS